jgi:hypothetical protein
MISAYELNPKHKVIDLIVASWQKFNKKAKKLSQCHKCQNSGHAAINCGLQYRCMNCLDNHEPGKCTKVKGKDIPVCVNCKMDHPANSTKCKFFIDHKTKVESFKRPRVTPSRQR